MDDAFVWAGVCLIVGGVACYDWRLGLIVAGVWFGVVGLLLVRKEYP
jgi:hypothetical protein